jgi:hypothetical protein
MKIEDLGERKKKNFSMVGISFRMVEGWPKSIE